MEEQPIAATRERWTQDRAAARLLAIVTAHLRQPDDAVPAAFSTAILGYAAYPNIVTDTPALRLIDPQQAAMAPPQDEHHEFDGGAETTDEQRHLAHVLRLLQPYADTPGTAFWIILEATPQDEHRYTVRWWISDNRSIVAMPERSGTWTELLQPPKAAAALGRHTAPWRNSQASVLSARPFLVARDAMLEANRPTVWNVAGDVAVYREADQHTGSYLDVQRQCAAQTPDGMLAELARTGGDALADVYAAITARYIAAGAPDHGIWGFLHDPSKMCSRLCRGRKRPSGELIPDQSRLDWRLTKYTLRNIFSDASQKASQNTSLVASEIIRDTANTGNLRSAPF